MTTPQSITSEIQKLAPSAVVELFEIDATALGGDVLRVHAGTNELRQNVVWQGNTYTAFPMQATGFDFSGNGQLPRPKLVMSNATGAMTLLVLTYSDLLGAKVTRRRTLVKYLDAVNFPNTRRNLLTYSEQFTGAPWVAYWEGATVTTGFADPLGTSRASKITPVTTGAHPTTSGLINLASLPSVAGMKVSIWLRADDPTTQVSFGIDDSTGTAVTLSTSWQRYSFTAAAPNGTGRAFQMKGNGTGTQPWYAWGAQVEIGTSVSEYQQIGATWSNNTSADPTAEFPVDIFYIDRKASETRDLVEFELASSFDVAGVKLPRRQIVQNVCTWRYRGTECGYTGTNYFNANDASVGSLSLDKCGKRLSSCKVRFGANNPLPFGSFPAAGLTR